MPDVFSRRQVARYIRGTDMRPGDLAPVQLAAPTRSRTSTRPRTVITTRQQLPNQFKKVSNRAYPKVARRGVRQLTGDPSCGDELDTRGEVGAWHRRRICANAPLKKTPASNRKFY
jgi:hypothetical protein